MAKMKNVQRSLLIALVVVLSLITFVDFGYSQSSLIPWVRFNGTYQVTAGIGTGALTLNASVFEMDYQNGEVWIANVSGVESIRGAKVVLSGATRTGDYSFNGDPANPDDVRFKIISTDGFVYFDANLADSVFVRSGTLFVWLNQFLDANNLATLNLYNVSLNTDAAHPSRYIQELSAYLSASSVSGMKMQLRVPATPGSSFTTNGTGVIAFGLIDGLQSLNTPPVANAGDDITIPSNQVASTTVQGTVTDADAAYVLTCSWTDENGNILKDWASVGIDGLCPLDLSTTSLGIGTHTLTLGADDGEVTTSDVMVLTINNSVPNANAGPDVTITSEEVAAITIQGVTTDFDNSDMLYCKWTEGATVLKDWTLAGTNGECPLSGLTLGRGLHTLTLTATDGQATSSDEMVLTINNTPPIANAGENITVTSDQIAATSIQGTASDFDGDAITCRWTEGVNVLQNWTPAVNGECVLSLSTHSFSLGEHTLAFEASDGQAISSNTMKLTVNNSAPHAAPGGAGVYQINAPVTLPGDVSDFDGDLLHYVWTDGANALCSGDIQSIAGGTSVLLPDCVVSNMSLGTHSISLQVSDGINLPVTKSVTVQIVDTTAPTLNPVANKYILWPPDHKMINIAIAANATDNSGCPVTINATVSSNEPISGLNSGDKSPDWTVPVINQSTGMINLQLRAERSGRGNGRKYTVTITATDCSGNVSTAKVKILVPKDQDNNDRKREDKEERDRDDRNDKKNCNERDDD
jgi:hypothetical protein